MARDPLPAIKDILDTIAAIESAVAGKSFCVVQTDLPALKSAVEAIAKDRL